ncbi:MAG: TldD/PmbA family protein [Bradymonadia bacterium]
MPVSITTGITFFNELGVDETLMKRGLEAALSMGADEADLFFEYRSSQQLGLLDGAVDRAYSGVSLGVGIRAIKDGKTGYAYTEVLDVDAVRKAARTAASVADLNNRLRPEAIRLANHPDFYPIKHPWSESGIENKLPLLRRINERAFSDSAEIEKVSASLAHSESHVLHVHSNGFLSYDYRPMGRVSVQCTAVRNGQRETNSYSRSARTGFELFDPSDLDIITSKAVERTLFLFDAQPAPAGQFPLVLASGASGILLHEAIGHGMEADFNRKGVSIYADKLNQRIASDEVTIVDDGTVPNTRGALNHDDEGVSGQRTVLVENGILRTYMHDRISAQIMSVQPTGNGRRQSFRHPPLPRMRATYMTAGKREPEEIIDSVKHGIYASSFTNGSVMIGAGDFSFYIKTGYLIENGKLTRPIKDTNIIGNGPEVLRMTDMVANDFRMDDGNWVCGKDGQSVPVSIGMPTCRVESITVGGVNEKSQ